MIKAVFSFVALTLIFWLGSTLVFDQIENVAIGENAQSCLVDAEVLDDVRKRENLLKQREESLANREKELEEKERSLKEELDKLAAERAALTALRVTTDKKQEEKVSKLVETLEKMSPKASSKLIASINPDLAVEAMSRIATPRLAKIMNGMDPKVSSKLSEMMALGKSYSRSRKSRGPSSSDSANLGKEVKNE